MAETVSNPSGSRWAEFCTAPEILGRTKAGSWRLLRSSLSAVGRWSPQSRCPTLGPRYVPSMGTGALGREP